MKRIIMFLCFGISESVLCVSELLSKSSNDFLENMFYVTQQSDAEIGIRLFQSKNYKAALPYLQRAAKAGNIQVLFYLGNIFEKGLGTTKNYIYAFNMYKRGVDYGNAECIYGLGCLYASGLGVTASQNKAFDLFKQSADKGFAYAANQTSYYLYMGIGTTKNVYEAIKYAQKAFELGDTEKCEWLGLLYYSGEEITQDYKKALYYFTRPNAVYSQSTRLITALMLYLGQGTSLTTIDSYPCTYEQRFNNIGVEGKTYIAEALTIVDQLVKEGYEDAYRYQLEWKSEYDRLMVAANKTEAPKFTQEIANYVHKYNVPREMAYCGGRAQYRAIIHSNGQVNNIRTLVCSVAAKANFDQTFLLQLPRFIPGTKGGKPVDMEVTFWLDWVPKRNLRIVQYSVYKGKNDIKENSLFSN